MILYPHTHHWQKNKGKRGKIENTLHCNSNWLDFIFLALVHCWDIWCMPTSVLRQFSSPMYYLICFWMSVLNSVLSAGLPLSSSAYGWAMFAIMLWVKYWPWWRQLGFWLHQTGFYLMCQKATAWPVASSAPAKCEISCVEQLLCYNKGNNFSVEIKYSCYGTPAF